MKTVMGAAVGVLFAAPVNACEMCCWNTGASVQRHHFKHVCDLCKQILSQPIWTITPWSWWPETFAQPQTQQQAVTEPLSVTFKGEIWTVVGDGSNKTLIITLLCVRQHLSALRSVFPMIIFNSNLWLLLSFSFLWIKFYRLEWVKATTQQHPPMSDGPCSLRQSTPPAVTGITLWVWRFAVSLHVILLLTFF